MCKHYGCTFLIVPYRMSCADAPVFLFVPMPGNGRTLQPKQPGHRRITAGPRTCQRPESRKLTGTCTHIATGTLF